MTVFFLVAFVAGLALAVYSMLQGVERSSAPPGHRPSAVFNTPIASVFAIVLGAVGYLLFTRSRLGLQTVVTIGLSAALAATVGAIALLARWALPYSGRTSAEETTQGLLALVTRSITPSKPGEISFLKDGVRQILAAESIQKTEIPCDTEVVIDTIHDGVAQVERWSSVEKRL